MKEKDIIFGLSASKKLAAKVAKHLDVELGDICIRHFADGETFVAPIDSVRDINVYIIQSTSKPVNENLMELLIAIDAVKRASSRSITVICPYYGYARQDRKTGPREPITCKLISKVIESAGADRVVLVDLHSDQTQGFYEIPVDTVTATFILMKAIAKDYSLKNAIIVSPDYGSVKRARKLAHLYNLPIAILDKRRPEPNKAEICNILGDVKGKNCIIIDDMIDTGGTLLAGCEVLRKNGAKAVIAGATHGLFSGESVGKFRTAARSKIFDALYITNTIDAVNDLDIKNLHIVDISEFIAQMIIVYASHGQKTISELYKATK